jgi:hypothetical protein
MTSSSLIVPRASTREWIVLVVVDFFLFEFVFGGSLTHDMCRVLENLQSEYDGVHIPDHF